MAYRKYTIGSLSFSFGGLRGVPNLDFRILYTENETFLLKTDSQIPAREAEDITNRLADLKFSPGIITRDPWTRNFDKIDELYKFIFTLIPPAGKVMFFHDFAMFIKTVLKLEKVNSDVFDTLDFTSPNITKKLQALKKLYS